MGCRRKIAGKVPQCQWPTVITCQVFSADENKDQDDGEMIIDCRLDCNHDVVLEC